MLALEAQHIGWFRYVQPDGLIGYLGAGAVQDAQHHGQLTRATQAKGYAALCPSGLLACSACTAADKQSRRKWVVCLPR